MRSVSFQIGSNDLTRFLKDHPNLGKNKDVGDFGVDIAKLYLLSLGAKSILVEPEAGVDISAIVKDKLIKFEVKATVDPSIAFSKLKVSSTKCHNLLVQGMEIMRICGVGNEVVDIHFLKHGEDFELIPEPRWRLKRL